MTAPAFVVRPVNSKKLFSMRFEGAFRRVKSWNITCYWLPSVSAPKRKVLIVCSLLKDQSEFLHLRPDIPWCRVLHQRQNFPN